MYYCKKPFGNIFDLTIPLYSFHDAWRTIHYLLLITKTSPHKKVLDLLLWTAKLNKTYLLMWFLLVVSIMKMRPYENDITLLTLFIKSRFSWMMNQFFCNNTLNIIIISVMMRIWLYFIIFVERKEKFVIQPSCQFPESLWSFVQRNMDYLYYTIASVLEGQWLECVKSFEGLDSFGTIKNLPNQYQKITWPNFLSVIQ